MGRFSKKTQKLLTKFPDLAISGACNQWGCRCISASLGQVLNGGPVRAVAEQVPVWA